MLVGESHRAVVIPAHAGDATLVQQRDHLVRPWRVADEVSQMMDRVNVASGVDRLEHSLQCREIGVNIGHQGEPHQTPAAGLVARMKALATFPLT